jgi:hypothetical protein
MQLVGMEEAAERVVALLHAWIILAEDGQPGRGDQVGGRLTRKLSGQR